MRQQAPDGAQSLDRAIQILQMVGTKSDKGIRMADVVSQTALTKPTVHRMLKALERNGLVEQDVTTRLYHLGPEAGVLGAQARSRFGIYRAAGPSLNKIAIESQDTAFLSVRRGDYALCLERIEGDYPIRTHVIHAGTRHPLGVGAGSVAMLSSYSDAEIEVILGHLSPDLAKNYPAFPLSYIRDLIGETRVNGFALNPGRLLTDSWAIGVPVLDAAGGCLGALSISAIAQRVGPERRPALARLLKEEAVALAGRIIKPSARFGGVKREGRSTTTGN